MRVKLLDNPSAHEIYKSRNLICALNYPATAYAKIYKSRNLICALNPNEDFAMVKSTKVEILYAR